jgi:predicted methyltransferase
MFMSRIATGLLATLVCLAPVAAPAQSSAEAVLDAAIAGPQRSGVNKARDVYRHPKEVLLFFGFKPDMTVVEIWPDTGWFSEILAPALRQRGRYVAAQYPLEHRTTTPANRAARVAFDAMVAANPAAYDQVVSSDLAVPDRLAMVPPGSADLVLSFRSVHVWMARKYEDAMFKAAYDALKPGGVFGVTDHRAPEGWSREKQVGSGYVTESFVIAAAQKAGFRLAGTSELKANPRDTKDYPKGVWALPPALAYGDQDRAKYLAIGESDRMVIKFIKP